jgi:hypothetical protein
MRGLKTLRKTPEVRGLTIARPSKAAYKRIPRYSRRFYRWTMAPPTPIRNLFGQIPGTGDQ